MKPIMDYIDHSKDYIHHFQKKYDYHFTNPNIRKKLSELDHLIDNSTDLSHLMSLQLEIIAMIFIEIKN